MSLSTKTKELLRPWIQKIRRMLNPVPLWIQLIFIMILLTTAVSVQLVHKDYTSTKELTLSQYLSTTSQILALESENSDWYLDSLAKFCIQPYYDSSYTRIIDQKTPITTEQLSYVKQQMFYNYYTRSDILDYELYLINQDMIIGRNESQQHFTVQQNMDIQPFLDAAEKCKGSPRNLYIESDASGNLTYYHTLFTVPGQIIQAVVQVTLDDSFTRRLVKDHNDTGEIFLLLNNEQELIYSSADTLPFFLSELLPLPSSEQPAITLNNQSYYLVSNTGTTGDLTMVCLMPEACIDAEIGHLGHSILINGFLFWLITVVLIYLLLKLLMNPLKELSVQMQRTGAGDFSTRIQADGCQETCELSQSFNGMVRHIDRLIDENYVAKLRANDARLAALEAQLNPHFLYNTLQAISTEALINDQPQIHKMITSLASNLRYTIKGNVMVPLRQEMNYTDNYVFLQKVRMGDALVFSSEIDPASLDCLIPKISIQTLVENSIIHGKSEKQTSIHITVTVKLMENDLLITVRDSGCGISDDRLQKIYEDFASQKSSGKDSGIGLANLYSRMQILYNRETKFVINTEEGKYTSISLTLPVSRDHSQDIFHERSTHVPFSDH